MLPGLSQAPPTADLQAQLERDFPQRLVLAAGGRQALRECGAGPTVVMLHGIGSGAASWLQVAQHLAPRARVIAWDAPGYGDSSPLESDAPKAEQYATRLAQMLDALSVEQCVLVGHSLGALTALALARSSQANRVSRLILISPARGYGAPQHAAQRQQVRQQRLDNLQRLGIAGLAKERSAHMLSPCATPQALAWVRWNMERLNPVGYRQAIELLCGDDLLRHGQPDMPCEVHCGEADSITTAQTCLSVAKALGAGFNLIADAGHASPIEQPQVVAGRLAFAIQQSLTGTRL
ncbi:alpha/beta fold hydrolase [Pseudomonas mucidolens]|uniref:Pimeloyl-ACP methyl ester carboxylesterase n=1 Tax=Pseudomonas mucidolens TaxID=46679 RepID=A0A1H2NUK5_9PSED|nr:alpha/beta hydrolase [Pseudomonas mucidolens]SDV09074.1 Pimeloyl-ACP methyl ester carboxylesterase [Pseudomonas mucidolens]SQH37491.1 alpha/beta fold family hydrolase [Pseudomonas mucidolens]